MKERVKRVHLLEGSKELVGPDAEQFYERHYDRYLTSEEDKYERARRILIGMEITEDVLTRETGSYAIARVTYDKKDKWTGENKKSTLFRERDLTIIRGSKEAFKQGDAYEGLDLRYVINRDRDDEVVVDVFSPMGFDPKEWTLVQLRRITSEEGLAPDEHGIIFTE